MSHLRARIVALGGVDGDDHAVVGRPRGRTGVTKRRVVVARQLDAEFPPHLPLPLRDERRRRQHQDRPHQPAHQQLREDQAGLDGLAQPDLVAEHRPPAQAAQDGGRGAGLVLEEFHLAYHRQRDEAIEPGMRGQPGGAQGEVELRGRGGKGRLAEDLEIAWVECDVGVRADVGRRGAGRRRVLGDQAITMRGEVFEPRRLDGGLQQPPSGGAGDVDRIGIR
jgi:hypothetical protein